VRSLATPLVDAYRLMINKQNALALFRLIIALVANLAAERGLVAQIYITNGTNGTIGEYSLSGAVINPALVSGLHNPTGLAVYRGNIYVANSTTGTIGEYDATTGAAVNPALITGLGSPNGLKIINDELFATNNNGAGIYGAGVSVYDPTTGATLNPSLVSHLGFVTDLAISQGKLFVVDEQNNHIQEYDAATGTPINPNGLWLFTGIPVGIVASGTNLYFTDNFPTGLVDSYSFATGAPVENWSVGNYGAPYGIALNGSDLFFVDNYYNRVTELTVSGTKIASSFIGGLDGPNAIAIVPEPSTLALAALGFLALAAWRVRRR
jgi:hypothetical protein